MALKALSLVFDGTKTDLKIALAARPNRPLRQLIGERPAVVVKNRKN